MTNTMSCGCEITSDNLGAYKIEYCPKHKATDVMYEALINAKSHLLMAGCSPDSFAIRNINETLAKADGGK